MNLIGLIIFVFYFLLVAGALLIYLFIILPTLKRYGQDHSAKFFPSDQYEQARKFKKICIENKLPMIYSQFFGTFKISAPILFIVFMVIVLIKQFGILK